MAIIALQVLSFKGNLKANTAPPQSMAVVANNANYYVVAYAISKHDTLYYDGQPIIRPAEIDPAPPVDIQHLTAYLGNLKNTTNTSAPERGEGHTIPCASYEEGIQKGIDMGLFPPTVAQSY